jgi:hypothetical protein
MQKGFSLRKKEFKKGERRIGWSHLYLAVYKILKSPFDMEKLITSNHLIFLFDSPRPSAAFDRDRSAMTTSQKKVIYRLIADFALSNSLCYTIAFAQSNPSDFLLYYLHIPPPTSIESFYFPSRPENKLSFLEQTALPRKPNPSERWRSFQRDCHH